MQHATQGLEFLIDESKFREEAFLRLLVNALLQLRGVLLVQLASSHDRRAVAIGHGQWPQK
jgi:hypothetical protein